jgi:outer membrane protein OmpA-like peptidoglycan-associated protein
MKSTSMFTLFNSAPIFSRRVAASCLAVASLAGCSTMKDLSPFGSNVPYAQDIKPTIAQPAVTEVPAFKPAPPAPKPIAAAPAPAAPAPAAPASDAPPPAPPGPQSSLSAQSNAALASAAPAPASPAAASTPVASTPAGSAPAVSLDTQTASAAPFGRVGHPPPRNSDTPPSIPDEQRRFNDDGTYPNLAQVPARPVNMPTFLEASTIEKSLLSDRDAAKDKRPESPRSPSPDSAPDQTGQSQAAVAAPTSTPAAVVARGEDAAPCLSSQPVAGQPAATLRFAPGSAALNSDDLAILADAIPVVRGGTGTIRVFGHGDADSGVSQATRFDLAAARAGAVAQALAGYGIPVPRIAVGVACADASLAGASVQLYAES